jgi:NADH-quinone oxidoreductase subunit C
MAQALLEHVLKLFPDAVRGTHCFRGDETVVVASDRWHDVAQALRDDPACDMNLLVDLTAVDYPDREPRFEVVAHLVSLNKGHRLRIKTQVGDADGDRVEVASLTDLWASANWMERECFDMFGVEFTGHPDLRRILMYPEFEGHPLRKDYPAERAQPLVEYRDVPNIDKLPPFGNDEGMSFGRQTHGRFANEDEEA